MFDIAIYRKNDSLIYRTLDTISNTTLVSYQIFDQMGDRHGVRYRIRRFTASPHPTTHTPPHHTTTIPHHTTTIPHYRTVRAAWPTHLRTIRNGGSEHGDGCRLVRAFRRQGQEGPERSPRRAAEACSRVNGKHRLHPLRPSARFLTEKKEEVEAVRGYLTANRYGNFYNEQIIKVTNRDKRTGWHGRES